MPRSRDLADGLNSFVVSQNSGDKVFITADDSHNEPGLQRTQVYKVPIFRTLFEVYFEYIDM